MKKKIRIAVALGENGKWNAAGWSEISTDEALSVAFGGLDPNVDDVGHCFVEAEVEWPEPKTFQGEVVR